MDQTMTHPYFGRILVVDDTTANLQLLTNLLTEQGYVVHPASDGELALEFVQSTLPDLILLDIRMPGMDGFEVCRRLKADERTRVIPVIFISILENEHDKVKGFREGAVDYITKPFQAEEVLARVQTHLRLRELTEQLEQKVAARTEELHAANAQLRTEITERQLAEEALRESRQLLDNIVANSPGAIYRCANAPDWNMEFISAGITRISGYPAEDFLNNRVRTFASIIHPDDRRSVAETVAAGLERKEPYEMDYRVVAADGTLRWVHEQGQGVFSPDGQLLCLDGLILDITAQRKAEEALKLNAERMVALLQLNQMAGASLDELMEFAYEAAIRLTRSKLGYLGLMNEDETALDMQHWTREAMEECKVPDSLQIYRVETAGLWGEAVRQRRPIITNDYAASNPWKKGLPEGHVGLTRHMNLPVIVGGKIVLVAGVGNKEEEYTGTDVQQLTLLMEGMWRLIERKQAEQALSESERRYRRVFENSPVSLWEEDFSAVKVFLDNLKCEGITDIEGYFCQHPETLRQCAELVRIVDVNKAALDLHGAANKEELLHGLINTFTPESFDIFRQELLCLWKGGTEMMADAVVKTLGGEPRYVTVCFSVCPGYEESLGKVLVSLIDITKRKQAEKDREKLQEQFLQAQKMELVGRLAGGVAHDFNNLLGVIMGYTEVALEQETLDKTLREHLEEILAAVTRSTAITRQLLAFARKQTIAPQVLDLNQTVESMLKMLRRLIGEDIALTWTAGAELWRVKMDPSQLDQILANLCVNARDAITDVGNVTIQTQNIVCDAEYCAGHADALPGEYVLLAVSDDGCGMDRETLHRLFEPFFTTKEVGKGTGLGLATVYGIVRQNNGFVNVYSEPGHGTIFRIYLPRHAADQEEQMGKSPVAPIPRGRETILLVEDDTTLLGLVKIMLESLGYRVLAASTPGEAIRIAREHSEEMHLLLTDVIMPEMTGRDLAKDLSILYPTLRHLYMSGYTGNIIAHHGVLDQNISFIQKPFSRQVLATKVREVLDQA